MLGTYGGLEFRRRASELELGQSLRTTTESVLDNSRQRVLRPWRLASSTRTLVVLGPAAR